MRKERGRRAGKKEGREGGRAGGRAGRKAGGRAGGKDVLPTPARNLQATAMAPHFSWPEPRPLARPDEPLREGRGGGRGGGRKREVRIHLLLYSARERRGRERRERLEAGN